MLHEFIADHRVEITSRASSLSRARDPRLHAESPTAEVSSFLAEVAVTLRHERSQPGDDARTIGLDTSGITTTAARNGAQMLRAGHPIVEVVQTYGDVCQAVTSLAAEAAVQISAADFCVFNRCLDDAIGKAVSEHTRITEEKRDVAELHRLGFVAHELRDQLQTARLSVEIMKSSGQPIEGVAGQLLGTALDNLGKLIERTLSDVRRASGINRHDAFELGPFLREVAATAELHAHHRGLTFAMDAATTGSIEGDRELLMSAVMNLVHNALKFTRPGGNVWLQGVTSSTRLSLSVEDQCGGIPDSDRGVFASFTDRRGADRSGLGLGLSIAKTVIRAHNGDITVRNMPGAGCVFTIDLPLVAPRIRTARPRRALTA
jgi:signal transduction histidine kinase